MNRDPMIWAVEIPQWSICGTIVLLVQTSGDPNGRPVGNDIDEGLYIATLLFQEQLPMEPKLGLADHL